MSARACRSASRPTAAFAFAVALLIIAPARGALAQPTAHHPGAWTTADKWPGRTTWPSSVWAVHMGLVRGDTLFARPHSQVLAWGSWYPNQNDGGLWAWNPTTDVAASAGTNLSPLAVEFPPLNAFCSGHAGLPNGDLLILSGTERNIVGEKKSARFRHQDRTWLGVELNQRRWYGNATAHSMPGGGVIATGGNKYDHMILFGGRKQGTGDGALTSDIQRFAITNAGEWDPALADPTPGVSGSDWPDEREHHTLADQRKGPYFLFGGKGASGSMLSDVWQLALSNDHLQSYKWNQLTSIGGTESPAPRWRHVAVVDEEPQEQDRPRAPMYVYGGEDATGTPRDDLWKLFWDPVAVTWKWSPITGATGTSPGARSGHTAIWDEPNGRMVLFGGQGESGLPTDATVYLLTIPASGPPAWSTPPIVPGTPTGPSARTLHAMAANLEKSKLSNPPVGGWFQGVVFGGQRQDGSLSNELWDLFVSPGPTPSIRWVDRTPASGPAPAPRKRASVIVYDAYPTSAVVFGGEKADGSWDTHPWEMQFDALTWSEQTAVSLSLRGQAAFREKRPTTAMQPEIYDPATNTWTSYGPASTHYRPSYHMIFSASDGKLYSSGPNYFGKDSTFCFDPVAGTWSYFPTDFTVPLDAANGVLYRPNKILKIGDDGIPAGSTEYGPASAALQIDEVAPDGKPDWRPPLAAMARGRLDHTANMLPTGEVIVTGGRGVSDNDGNDPDDRAPRKRPEIWDPTDPPGEGGVGYWYWGTAAGDSLAAEPATRAHHSSAVLLPDGRILSGGGWDPHPDDVRRSVDQYSPPYLFQPGGAAAARPQLLGARDHITWTQTFKVACPDFVEAACLIRPGASTHAFNQDVRYVPLEKVSQDAHRVTLQFPAGYGANHAPPGNYLLFVLRDDAGRKVPSVARWVNVSATQNPYPNYATWDIVPPATINDLVVTGYTSTSHTLQWTAPLDAGDGSSGSAFRYEIRYRMDGPMPTLEDFFTYGTSVVAPAPLAAGQVHTFTVNHPPAGQVVYFRIISRDLAGSDRNWSAVSNEAQTPNGGGGCPFVDTRTAKGWEVENSILGRSLTGALALDGYRLRHAPEVVGGRVRLRVRENEQERTTLDQVRLVAVDHAPGVRAWPMGEEVVLGTRVAAERVTTSSGVDVTALVNGSGEGFAGAPGDTLLVELSSGAHAVAGEERATQSHNPFHIDDGGKCPPDCGSPLRSPAGEYSASAIDAQVLGSSGIQLQVPDGLGGWRTVVTRYPREHADQAVFEGLGHGPVRLVFVGRHRVRFVGRIERAGGEVVVQRLPLLVARHSRLGDVAAALDTTGARTSELAPGDTLSLEFGWTPLPEGQVRELFFLSQGIYTAILPSALSQVLPERFTIHKPRPNPFAGSTTLRFDLPLGRHVRLEVLDAQGRRVRTLANHALPPGSHAIEWDGRNEAGSRTGAGIYFYRFEAGEFREQGRMTFMP